MDTLISFSLGIFGLIVVVMMFLRFHDLNLLDALTNVRLFIGWLGSMFLVGGAMGAVIVAFTHEPCRVYFSALMAGAALRIIFLEWSNKS